MENPTLCPKMSNQMDKVCRLLDAVFGNGDSAGYTQRYERTLLHNIGMPLTLEDVRDITAGGALYVTADVDGEDIVRLCLLFRSDYMPFYMAVDRQGRLTLNLTFLRLSEPYDHYLFLPEVLGAALAGVKEGERSALSDRVITLFTALNTFTENNQKAEELRCRLARTLSNRLVETSV